MILFGFLSAMVRALCQSSGLCVSRAHTHVLLKLQSRPHQPEGVAILIPKGLLKRLKWRSGKPIRFSNFCGAADWWQPISRLCPDDHFAAAEQA